MHNAGANPGFGKEGQGSRYMDHGEGGLGGTIPQKL